MHGAVQKYCLSVLTFTSDIDIDIEQMHVAKGALIQIQSMFT